MGGGDLGFGEIGIDTKERIKNVDTTVDAARLEACATTGE
jgi:hypothetical protein